MANSKTQSRNVLPFASRSENLEVFASTLCILFHLESDQSLKHSFPLRDLLEQNLEHLRGLATTKHVMDDQTAKQRLEALLATAGEVHDLSTFFFENHPTPEEIQAIHDEESSREVATKCRTLVEALRMLLDRGKKYYSDRNFSVIWQYLIDDRSAKTEESIYPLLRNGLATMALAQHALIDSRLALTKRDKLLKFFLWIVRGRKDEDHPFNNKAGKVLEDDEDRHMFLPTSTLNYGDCAYCEAPGIVNTCRWCPVISGENHAFATFYCDRECMMADAENHKKLCEEVRALRRGTKIFAGLYLETLSQCDETDLQEISHDGSVVTARYETVDQRAYLGSPLFRKFPAYLAPSMDDAVMIMTHSHCREVFIAGETLFEMLVRPASALVEEVLIQPKNMRKTVLHIQGQEAMFNALYRHHPLRITLPCGLQFAFDPTAGQYGWKEILCPWDAYLKHRAHNCIRGVITKEPTNVSPQKSWQLARTRARPRSDAPINEALSHARRHVLEYVAMKLNILAGEYFTLFYDRVISVLLTSLRDDGFDLAWKVLFQQVQAAIMELMRKMQEGEINKLYFDFDMQPRLTQKEKTYQQLRKVWFSEMEYESFKSAERKERAWKRRLRKAFKNSRFED